jgi:hypothetical protein
MLFKSSDWNIKVNQALYKSARKRFWILWKLSKISVHGINMFVYYRESRWQMFELAAKQLNTFYKYSSTINVTSWTEQTFFDQHNFTVYYIHKNISLDIAFHSLILIHDKSYTMHYCSFKCLIIEILINLKYLHNLFISLCKYLS